MKTKTRRTRSSAKITTTQASVVNKKPLDLMEKLNTKGIVGLSEAAQIVFSDSRFPTEANNLYKLRQWLIKKNIKGTIIKARGNYANAFVNVHNRIPQLYMFNKEVIEMAYDELINGKTS